MKTKDVLAIQLARTDIGDVTVAVYLKTLLRTLWIEGEGFSGKRPFGNSGWELELYAGLIREKAITGELDEDGYVNSVDRTAGAKLILECIDALCVCE